MENIYLNIFFGFLFLIIVLLFFYQFKYRKFSKSLQQIKKGLDKINSGDFRVQMPNSSDKQVGALYKSINFIAKKLADKVESSVSQSNEIDLILRNMSDGLIAINSKHKIIKINKPAKLLLDIKTESVIGKSIQEAIRNSELQDLAITSLKNHSSSEKEIVLYDGSDQYWRARATPLIDAQGDCVGSVVVLNDITKMRQLERIRRDFVANVSHELKTPITSIKGFVETLLDGALHNTKDADKFLKIISSQSDRLDAIIEDLLSLSRIEEESESGKIFLEKNLLSPVINSSVFMCKKQLDDKLIDLKINCSSDVIVKINPLLFEQALVNLIINAIKYSSSQGEIVIDVKNLNSNIEITVKDYGCGIPEEHLDRLFERFYRVDKSRSRHFGGTGLGLSIVKHIIQTHNGSVFVDSAVGKGTTFTISLPAN